MFTVGYQLKANYPRPCANLPFLVGETGCTPVFLYALAYLSFEKCISTFLGTRIRGVYSPTNLDSLRNARFMKELYLIQTFSQLQNFVYVYKLLKKY